MVLRQITEQKTVRTWAQTEALLDLHGMGHQMEIKGLQQAAAATHQASETFPHYNSYISLGLEKGREHLLVLQNSAV